MSVKSRVNCSPAGMCSKAGGRSVRCARCSSPDTPLALVQDVRNQGRLAAEAEQHARDVKERNRYMRQIAAQSGIMQLPGMFATTHLGYLRLSPRDVETTDANPKVVYCTRSVVDKC